METTTSSALLAAGAFLAMDQIAPEFSHPENAHVVTMKILTVKIATTHITSTENLKSVGPVKLKDR